MTTIQKLFSLERNPILHPIVCFIIKMGWFDNRGKFKQGDKVKYNLFARIVIWSVVRDIEATQKVFTFSHYEKWSKDLRNCVLVEDSGCSVFWLRKLYPWERNQYKWTDIILFPFVFAGPPTLILWAVIIIVALIKLAA